MWRIVAVAGDSPPYQGGEPPAYYSQQELDRGVHSAPVTQSLLKGDKQGKAI